MKIAAIFCALIGLGSLCIPSFADTATYTVSSTSSITFGIVPNVFYSIVGPDQPTDYAAANQLAEVNYSPSSFSFNNGTLSYSFGPASGWASTPPVSPPNANSSNSTYFVDDQFYVGIQNKNDYSISVPVVASLTTYSGSASSEGVTYGYFQQFDTSASYQAFVEAIYQPAPYFPATLYVGASCEESICTSFTSQDESTWTESNPPIVSESSLLIPANSYYVVETIAGTRGTAYATTIPETPEPETFILLGSGMLGLIAINRRRLTGAQ